MALAILCAFVVESDAKLRLALFNIRILPCCQAKIQQYLTFEYDFRAKIGLKRSLLLFLESYPGLYYDGM